MGKDVWWVSNGLICSVYDGRQEHLITLITIPTGGQWGPVSRRMSSLQHLSCFICGKEIGKRPPVLPDWHCVQVKESGVTMWKGRYSVLTTFSSVATLGLTKPALSAAAQSLTNWSRSPPGTPSLSVSSLYCRQSQATTTHTASNVNSARSRWTARSTLWTKTTRYQLCLTLSLTPFSLRFTVWRTSAISLAPSVADARRRSTRWRTRRSSSESRQAQLRLVSVERDNSIAGPWQRLPCGMFCVWELRVSAFRWLGLQAGFTSN